MLNAVIQRADQSPQRAPSLRALGREARGICFSPFRGAPPSLMLLPPSQFLYALRHAPAVQLPKAHSHMVSGPYPDNRKIHG